MIIVPEKEVGALIGRPESFAAVEQVFAAMASKDFAASATLLTGMLANIPGTEATRKKTGRELVAQSYSRMGAVGLTFDENSPIAPLLQAARIQREEQEQRPSPSCPHRQPQKCRQRAERHRRRHQKCRQRERNRHRHQRYHRAIRSGSA